MARLFEKYRPLMFGVLALGIIGFIAIQFVDRFVDSFQRSNPPVNVTITWDSPETERVVRAACYDCHSNETVWPWYAYIAPVSWLVARDVNNGREALNFSEPYDAAPENLQHMMDMIDNGEMPLTKYIILHPDANLNDEEQAQLIAGIGATFNYLPGSVNMEGMDMSPQVTPEATP